MHEASCSPYPNPYEIIRLLLRSLDMKNSNKILDERADSHIFNPLELTGVILSDVSRYLKSWIGVRTEKIIVKILREELDKYLLFVGNVSADGLSREDINPILQQGALKYFASKLAMAIYSEFGGPAPALLFCNNEKTVPIVIDWLSENEPGWDKYVCDLNEDGRDRVSSWKRGRDLPSFKYIQLISEKNIKYNMERMDLERIRTLLLFSRAIDWFRRFESAHDILEYIRVALWGVISNFSMERSIRDAQQRIKQNIGATLANIAYLQQALRRTVKKEARPQSYRFILDRARVHLKSVGHYDATKYWLDWHEARWFVYSGNIDEANKFYKQAFDGGLFRAGHNQKDIIEEALVVAASLDKPDNVFLKHLKWALIIFSYDIPSVNTGQLSNKIRDNVEAWEVKMWKTKFGRVFPPAGWFPGTNYTLNNESGPFLITDSDKVKPDYRNPNRVISIGDNRKIRKPQLVWFAELEEFDICKKLLDSGASVNSTSESGDTPIMMALEALNVKALPPRTMNDHLFWLFSSYPHSLDIINSRTQKTRLLAIISAVETGRLDIVKKVLELGADPNGRGDTDEQTPLNVCIKLIGILKNPESAMHLQETMPITVEVLDSIRRYSAGQMGLSLEDQRHCLNVFRNNNINGDFLHECIKLSHDRVLQYMNISELRDIALSLIEAGANVNAEHSSPIKGYTPLMLAAELDECKLFSAMLEYGGNPRKSYTDKFTGKHFSCHEIATYFKSKNVLKLLEELNH